MKRVRFCLSIFHRWGENGPAHPAAPGARNQLCYSPAAVHGSALSPTGDTSTPRALHTPRGLLKNKIRPFSCPLHLPSFPLQIHPLHSPVPQGISAGYGNKWSPWRRSWELICLCLCPWEVVYTWLSTGKCRMLPGTAQEHSQVPGLGTKQRNLQPWWRGSSSSQHK